MSIDLIQNAPKKILVVNTFGIGDVLFTTPFISNLKINFPNCFIGYVGNRRTSTLLESNDDIDQVHVYERDEFKEIYNASKIQFLAKLKKSIK